MCKFSDYSAHPGIFLESLTGMQREVKKKKDSRHYWEMVVGCARDNYMHAFCKEEFDKCIILYFLSAKCAQCSEQRPSLRAAVCMSYKPSQC